MSKPIIFAGTKTQRLIEDTQKMRRSFTASPGVPQDQGPVTHAHRSKSPNGTDQRLLPPTQNTSPGSHDGVELQFAIATHYTLDYPKSDLANSCDHILYTDCGSWIYNYLLRQGEEQ